MMAVSRTVEVLGKRREQSTVWSPSYCIILLPDSNRQVLIYSRRNCCSSTLNSFALPSEQDPWKSQNCLICAVSPDWHLTNPVLPTALCHCQLFPKDQTSTKAHYLLFSFGLLPPCPSHRHTHISLLFLSQPATLLTLLMWQMHTGLTHSMDIS